MFGTGRKTMTSIALALALMVAVAAVALFGADVARAQEDNPPSAPWIVVEPRDGQIFAYWDPANGANKYHVTYSSDNRYTWSLALYGQNVNQVVIPNTDNDKSYVVAVRAGNDHGWSSWQNSISSIPYSMLTNKPDHVNATRYCDGSLEFSWPEVADNDKYQITGYDASVRYSESSDWKLVVSKSTHRQWSIQADKDEDYQVGVRARSDKGWSYYTTTGFMSFSDCFGPPTNIRAHTDYTSGQGRGGIKILWNAPSGREGVKYNVNIKSDYGNWTRVTTETASTTASTLDDVSRKYTVAVQAVDGDKTSGWVNKSVSAWLIPYNIGETSASVYLTGHSGQWWYKQSGNANCYTSYGSTLGLGSYTANTEYSVAAYKSSGCADEHLIATGRFRTK